MNTTAADTAPSPAASLVDAASLSSDLDCSGFTFGAYVVVFGTMFVFGTVGNCLSWAVLRWDRRSSGRVATFLLQTMAVVDNLFLLTAFISHFTSALTVYVESSASSADGNVGNATSSSPFSGGGSTANGNATSLDGFRLGDVSCNGSRHEANCFWFKRSYVISNATGTTLDGFRRADVAGPTWAESDGPNPAAAMVRFRWADGASKPPVSAYFGAYVNSLVTVCVWPLVHITQMWAVWITVLVAFNRYVAICRPFQAPRLCTMRQTRWQAFWLATAVVVYNIPRFFEHRITYVPTEVVVL